MNCLASTTFANSTVNARIITIRKIVMLDFEKEYAEELSNIEKWITLCAIETITARTAH